MLPQKPAALCHPSYSPRESIPRKLDGRLGRPSPPNSKSRRSRSPGPGRPEAMEPTVAGSYPQTGLVGGRRAWVHFGHWSLLCARSIRREERLPDRAYFNGEPLHNVMASSAAKYISQIAAVGEIIDPRRPRSDTDAEMTGSHCLLQPDPRSCRPAWVCRMRQVGGRYGVSERAMRG